MLTFKTIPEIDSRYLACSDGNIYSDMRKTRTKLQGGFCRKGNYLHVSILTIDGKRVSRDVHRLICIAFSGEAPEHYQAAHVDGNSTNNKPSNLTWKTVSDNLADRKIHGTHDGGSANSRASLTEDQVKQVRKLLSEGSLLHREIAELFGVTRLTITKINTGDRYKLWGEQNES